ncbi:hypothetical protein NQZ68_003992 [Dissostichus eleginoides]|nr:hypothetical protein NQZ68_003992 [Dissostichus eleginoides]
MLRDRCMWRPENTEAGLVQPLLSVSLDSSAELLTCHRWETGRIHMGTNIRTVTLTKKQTWLALDLASDMAPSPLCCAAHTPLSCRFTCSDRCMGPSLIFWSLRRRGSVSSCSPTERRLPQLLCISEKGFEELKMPPVLCSHCQHDQI